MINIRKNICPEHKWHIKCPYAMTPEFIVVHNTANDASAANEILYMNRNNNYVSYHFAVDDVEVVQGLPLDRNGWHAGDGAYGAGNRKGIGIEICYSLSGGARFDQAEKNATWLIAKLLHERGWGLDRVKKHQDFMNKYCPHRTLDYGWQRFLDMVKVELDKLNTPKNPPKPAITYQPIPKKKVRLVRDANLIDFSTGRAVKGYVVGEIIEVVAIATIKDSKFYMTNYSYDNGKIRTTKGFRVEDCEDEKVEEPKPIAPSAPSDPKTPSKTNNSEKADSSSEGETDYPKENNALLKKIVELLSWVVDKLKSIFK